MIDLMGTRMIVGRNGLGRVPTGRVCHNRPERTNKARPMSGGGSSPTPISGKGELIEAELTETYSASAHRQVFLFDITVRVTLEEIPAGVTRIFLSYIGVFELIGLQNDDPPQCHYTEGETREFEGRDFMSLRVNTTGLCYEGLGESFADISIRTFDLHFKDFEIGFKSRRRYFDSIKAFNLSFRAE